MNGRKQTLANTYALRRNTHTVRKWEKEEDKRKEDERETRSDNEREKKEDHWKENICMDMVSNAMCHRKGIAFKK